MLIPAEEDQERTVSLMEIKRLVVETNPIFAEHVREFIAQVHPEDTLVEFCTSLQAWRKGVGCAGYRAIRNGSLAAELITRFN